MIVSSDSSVTAWVPNSDPLKPAIVSRDTVPSAVISRSSKIHQSQVNSASPMLRERMFSQEPIETMIILFGNGRVRCQRSQMTMVRVRLRK